jgi:23S rRNA pseudouridine1911/1915/1917 synthase
VHRLDKDTEGLVVVAKSNPIHESLAKQFSDRSIVRRYWALVRGKFPDSLEVETAIGRHPRDRKKMAVVKRGGKPARTTARCLQRFDGFSWVECKLHTGRTHQIRVHLSHRGFPLLGDPLYGRGEGLPGLKGQALVAFELGFVHPRSEKNLHFQSDPPDWLRRVIRLKSLDA